MNNIEKLKNIKLFLLDMDGTIYLDDELFDGSLEFINLLRKKNINYIFLTNNSSKSQKDYLDKLERIGIPAIIDNIFTSGNAMGLYLSKNYPNKKVYLVGTSSLHKELERYNVNLVNENPDIVVLGFDRELTYEKLEKASEAIDNGALFLATNCDLVCPIAGHRYIPDCGSMCKMITNATKVEPTYIGKPSPLMIDILSEKLNIKKDEIAVVGDRVYTDIAAGYNAKTLTICVLSGESTMDTINASDIKPDIILDSIKDLIPLIKD